MPKCKKPDRKKREKIFGLPTSYGIDGNEAARLKAYAWGWTARHKQPGQHIGPLTRAHMGVLQALLLFANRKTGSCFPSYKAIAKAGDCAASTVGEAIPLLEFAGIIRIYNRLTRKNGGPVERTSNAYTFRPMAPMTEFRSGTRIIKESVLSMAPTSAPIDPDSPLWRALNRLGGAIEDKLLGKGKAGAPA